MKRIGVLTSGGDAPGMNAAIRSVVRCAANKGLEVKGIMRGYEGLIKGEVIDMNARSVSNILSRGGTILKTSRSEEFMTKSGREKAFNTVKNNNIDGLIIIGGNGSFKGAHELWNEFRVRNIGIPGTIDNDISGSDYTVGAHTAVNTALDAIDKIRDTVTSMERIYVVEVMGRDDPFIAIRVGLAGGAEDVIFPYPESRNFSESSSGSRRTSQEGFFIRDAGYDINSMCEDIIKGREKGKISWIIVVSEGAAKAADIAERIKEKTNFSVRAVVLGHIQRGGSPEAFDRVLASRLGHDAVEALIEGHTDAMVGIVSDEVKITPYAKACEKDRKKSLLDEKLYKLTRVLAT